MAKWTNIRDAFMRSLRTKSGQGAKKCYMYGDHLQFLLKVADKDDTDSNYQQFEDESQQINSATTTETLEFETCETFSGESTPSTSRHSNKSKRRGPLDEIEREILSELKKKKDSIEPCRSDQEILLMSFLPFIRDMRESELMDFQMSVLQNIKTIKQRRKDQEKLIINLDDENYQELFTDSETLRK